MEEYPLIPVKKSDCDRLSIFLADIFGRTIDFWLSRFRFIWDDNPAFEGERGFLVERQGKVIGFIGKFTSKFLIAGRPEIVFNGMGLAVDPGYRHLGLGKKLRKAHYRSCEQGILFATTPTPVTAKINQKLGFKLLPTGIGTDNIVCCVPVNYLKFMEYYLYFLYVNRQNKTFVTSNLKKCLVRGNAREKNEAEIDIREIKKPDSSFDQLWDQTKLQVANTNIRTAEVISWYLLPVEGVKKYLYGGYRNGRLVGYAMFVASEKKNIRLLTCADLWWDFRDRGFPGALTANASRIGKNLMVDLVLFPYFSEAFFKYYHDRVIIYGNPRTDTYFCFDPEPEITERNSYFVYLQGDRLTNVRAIL